MSDVIGVREAAKLLKVHENTVRNWAKAGILADVRVVGTGQLRLSRAQVERLAQRPAVGLPKAIAPDVEAAYREGYRDGRADALREVKELVRGLRV